MAFILSGPQSVNNIYITPPQAVKCVTPALVNINGCEEYCTDNTVSDDMQIDGCNINERGYIDSEWCYIWYIS